MSSVIPKDSPHRPHVPKWTCTSCSHPNLGATQPMSQVLSTIFLTATVQFWSSDISTTSSLSATSSIYPISDHTHTSYCIAKESITLFFNLYDASVLLSAYSKKLNFAAHLCWSLAFTHSYYITRKAHNIEYYSKLFSGEMICRAQHWYTWWLFLITVPNLYLHCCGLLMIWLRLFPLTMKVDISFS